jgi:hypothetical protein
MAEVTYQIGNTIRLKCTFKDFDGQLRNPDMIKVKIYDQSFAVMSETTLGPTNNSDLGNWFYDYVIPMDARGKLYYEWYGEMQGSPSLKRDSFKVAFM